MFWAWNWKSPPKNLHKGIYKTLINFWWIRRNWDKASLLQIFHILEFIWWPSHRNYLFVDRKWKWLRLILSDLFPNQIWIFFFCYSHPQPKLWPRATLDLILSTITQSISLCFCNTSITISKVDTWKNSDKQLSYSHVF